MRTSPSLALVFVAACAEPLAPPRQGDPAEVPKHQLEATHSGPVEMLLDAPAFETPSRGLSLSDPPYWVAWRDVLHSATAAADFRYLYANATTAAGRMYGAAGILANDPAALPGLADDPDWTDVEITVVSGCLVSNDPALMLLDILATPRMREYFRTGSYPDEPALPGF